jgi:protein-tyrosine phosphatase
MESRRKNMIISKVKMILALKFKKDDPLPVEVVPGVFIGSIGAALNKNFLLENQISHILTVADNLNSSFPELFTYKSIEILDTIEFNILNVFDEAFSFIDTALAAGQKVLVHCFAGKSRSATIIIAYLMKNHSMSLDSALKFLKSKRPVIMPNQGFLFQLSIYENSLLSSSQSLI